MEITITIPPELEQALSQTDQSPEEFILQILTQTLLASQKSTQPDLSEATTSSQIDPLFELAGCITSKFTDIADQHDYYLGQTLHEELHPRK